MPSMGSHRVGHDWSNLAAAAAHTWHYAKCLTLVISFNPHPHSPTLRFLSPPCSDGDSGTQNLQSWEDLLVMTQSSVLRRRIILTGCGPAWEELRCQAIFADGNPAGIKCLMSLMGLCKNVLRLPLVPVSDNVKQDIENEYNNKIINF